MSSRRCWNGSDCHREGCPHDHRELLENECRYAGGCFEVECTLDHPANRRDPKKVHKAAGILFTRKREKIELFLCLEPNRGFGKDLKTREYRPAWHLIGGKRDEEESQQDTAVREFMEEAQFEDKYFLRWALKLNQRVFLGG